jgi:predicted transcriptional regulator
MTKSQACILESIAALPEAERRELIEHLVATNMGAPSFYERMTPEQRAHLAEGIAQADRGEGRPAEEVYADLARSLALAPR